ALSRHGRGLAFSPRFSSICGKISPTPLAPSPGVGLGSKAAGKNPTQPPRWLEPEGAGKAAKRRGEMHRDGKFYETEAARRRRRGAGHIAAIAASAGLLAL